MCNGGTFEFNHEKSQGIKYGNFAPNTPKVCSSNMPGMLSAVYEPNKITLNWIDRDTITQTQCTYDTPIVFPSEPVRPGYKFMGWQIKAKE